MYQALYRKWRPKTFDDVYGQEHITDILKSQVSSADIPHAYLFYGSRGTGKTSCAKILAKAVNCHNPQNGSPCGECPSCKLIDSGLSTDILEIDAASNNRVDNVRSIRDDVAYAPSQAKYRVLIIDEVHMLTTQAFNALLKTLEEPPQHMIFILATTEKQKIPNTIISRCQRFDFHRIAAGTISARLRTVADAEQIAISDDALYLIARISEGGMRDALGFLELCKGVSHELSKKEVAQIIGVTDDEVIFSTARAIQNKDYDSICDIVNSVYEKGDITVFAADILEFWHNMLLCNTSSGARKFLNYDDSDFNKMKELALSFGSAVLLYHINVLESLHTSLKASRSSGKIPLQLALIKMCDRRMDQSPSALALRISVLEERLVGLGNAPIAAAELKSKKAKLSSPSLDKEPVALETKASTPNKTSDKEKLIKIGEWPDIAKHVSQRDKALGAFLRSYQAYRTESLSDVYIFAGDTFSMSMIDEEKKKLIACAVCVVLDVNIPAEHVFIKDGKNKETDFELIDEIIAQIE